MEAPGDEVLETLLEAPPTLTRRQDVQTVADLGDCDGREKLVPSIPLIEPFEHSFYGRPSHDGRHDIRV